MIKKLIALVVLLALVFVGCDTTDNGGEEPVNEGNVQGMVISFEDNILFLWVDDAHQSYELSFVVGEGVKITPEGSELLLGNTVTVSFIGELDSANIEQEVEVTSIEVLPTIYQVEGTVYSIEGSEFTIVTDFGFEFIFTVNETTRIDADVEVGSYVLISFVGAWDFFESVQDAEVLSIESLERQVEQFVFGTIITIDSDYLTIEIDTGMRYTFSLEGANVVEGLQAGDLVNVVYEGRLNDRTELQSVQVIEVRFGIMAL